MQVSDSVDRARGSIPPGSTISGVQMGHLAPRIRANSCGLGWLRQLEGSPANVTAPASRARKVNQAFPLCPPPRIARRNYRDVKIIRNILAGLALAGLAACGAPVQPTSTPAPQQQAPLISNVIAFMGDSITQYWDISVNDPAPTVNLGIAGQTTPQMLARFNDLIASAPGVVVILGGINDIAQYANGVITIPPDIESIKAMAVMAQAAGIRVILCSVLPTHYNSVSDPLLASIPATVEDFNQQLMSLAKESGYLYADYYDAMLSPGGAQNTALFMDAVHPNTAGYAVMWSVLAPLLQEDLQ